MGLNQFLETRLGAALVVTGTAALLCGCTSINSETGPSSPGGPAVSLDTLTPTATAKARDRMPAKPDAGAAAAPSVVSVTRENWKATPFDVPVSGVQHHPIYTDDKPRFARETARARGEYPTQLTVLDVTTQSSGGSLALEGLAAPVRAAWDVVRMPVLAVRNAPWSVQQSPIDKQAYQRGPLTAKKTPVTGTPVAPPPAAPPIDPKAEQVGKSAAGAEGDGGARNEPKKEVK